MSAQPEALYGPWDYRKQRQQWPYDDTASYRIVAEWLDGHGLIEDWGCGTAWLRTYLHTSEYRGLDGAWSQWMDEQVDLRTYTSSVPCIAMRHVLEHNFDWRDIAANFAASWTQRAALVMFIMPQPEEHDTGGPEWPVPDIAVSGPDLFDLLDPHGDVTFDYVDLEYPPDNSIQWGWEGVVLMERP
jgi:hypothetical protein